MLRALLNFVRGYTRSFNRYELAILDAVAAELPTDIRVRFKKRISALQMIQRHGGGQEVIAYQRKRGEIVFPDDTQMTSDRGEVVLASFRVQSDSPMTALEGKVWLWSGNFTSIEFNRPTEHAEADDVDAIEVTLGPKFWSASANAS